MKSLLPCTGAPLAAIAFWFVCIAGSSIALADAAKDVGEIHSVQFKTTMTRPRPSGQTVTFEIITILDASGRGRTTFRQGDVVDSITVTDFRTVRSLTLHPKEKQAELMERVNLPADRTVPNPVKDFTNIHDKDGTPVGEKVIGGKKTKGFKVPTSSGEEIIWADMDTRLPVEIDDPRGTDTDFQWNLPLDESLFSLTPPAGYELTTRQMDASPEQEKDLVNALKNLAELNGGVYPDTFDSDGMLKARLKSSERLLNTGNPDPDSPEWQRLHDPNSPEWKRLYDPKSPEWKQCQERDLQAGLVIYRGFKFASGPKNGDNWHYAGMNVPAGKAAVPIFWYHPKDSANYHVIDADLKIHEVAPADLPQIPSQTVVNPMKRSAATTNPQPAKETATN